MASPRKEIVHGTFFLLALVLGTVPLVFGQKTPILTGKMIDAETKLPIRYVNVRIVGTRYGAVTDSLGRYVIVGVPEGLQLVKVTHLAYATDSATIMMPANRDTVVLNGRLHPRPIQTGGITITATRDSIVSFYRDWAQRDVTTEDIVKDAIIDVDGLFLRYAPFAQNAGYVLWVDGFNWDPEVLQSLDIHEIKEMIVWRWTDAPAEFKTGLGKRAPGSSQVQWGIKPYVILIKTRTW